MKRVAAVLVIATLLSPGAASADWLTDVLGLSALSGQPVAVERRVIVERRIIPTPPPATVSPAPVYYQRYVEYVPVPQYAPVQSGWCPPGQAKQGRCEEHWRRHRR